MSLLPKSIHRCRRYPTKFNSGRDIPQRAEKGGIDAAARSAFGKGFFELEADWEAMLETLEH